MKFKLSTGEEVEVEFHHAHDPADKQRLHWTTVAMVRLGGHLLTAGNTRVHPMDNFSRVAGRKVALRRALENVPREVRKQIWTKLIEKGMRVS